MKLKIVYVIKMLCDVSVERKVLVVKYKVPEKNDIRENVLLEWDVRKNQKMMKQKTLLRI